jgi:hypothetical protein
MSLIEYHKSTTNELLSLTNKVRNLVQHWGEDGRYKEAVLKNIIRRYLPEKYLIGTGFVVKQTDNRGEHLTSRQLDLIIYDDSSPILFKEGDFVILTADSIRGIIEIKANLQNQGLTPVIKQANENGNFIFSGKTDKDQNFFNGVFSYEGYSNGFSYDTFAANYNEADDDFRALPDFSKFKVNHVSLNKDFFLKYWGNHENPHHSLYQITDLSFPFFISNLTDTLANTHVEKNNFIWFPEDKELGFVAQF